MTALATEVLNPVDAERKIQELSDRIAKGVGVITSAERDARTKKRAYDLAYAHAYKKAEGPVHERRYTADILTMAQREKPTLQTLRSSMPSGQLRRWRKN